MNIQKSKKCANFFFYFFIFLCVISLSCLFSFRANSLKVHFAGNVNADVCKNIETKESNFDKIKILINDRELNAYIPNLKNSYITYVLDNYPVYSIKLKADKKV